MAQVKTSSVLVGKLIARSAAEGGKHALLEGVEIDWAADCQSPVNVHMNGRPIEGHPRPFFEYARHADLLVRCRQCPNCLKHRAKKWAARAVAELAFAQRSWFVTLTLTPHRQFETLAMARRAYLASGDLDREHKDVIFRKHVAQQSSEITRWLKRLRKVSGAKLRYAIVVEAHKSGQPHYHVLVHEVIGSAPLLHRHIGATWNWGFSSATLVKSTSPAWYVAKYLAKSSLARIRASGRYGQGGMSAHVTTNNVRSAVRQETPPVWEPNLEGLGEDDCPF